MSGYRSLQHFLAEMALAARGSRHRVARMQRFIFRHPRKHRAQIRALLRREHDTIVRNRDRYLPPKPLILG